MALEPLYFMWRDSLAARVIRRVSDALDQTDHSLPVARGSIEYGMRAETRRICYSKRSNRVGRTEVIRALERAGYLSK